MNNHEIMEQLLKVKNKINLFDDLTDHQIKLLVKDIIFKKYTKHEIIFRQGEDKNQFIYFILAGSVKITLTDQWGVRKIITTVPQGAIIGELQAIVDNKRTAGCLAASDDNILIGFTINDYNLKEHGNVYAVFYRNLSKILAHKLHDTNSKVR